MPEEEKNEEIKKDEPKKLESGQEDELLIEESHEKLLRSPTLNEKYIWLKPLIISILIIILLLIAGFIVRQNLNYFAGPENNNLNILAPTTTPNPPKATISNNIDNWLTYVSAEGKYSIKYPKEFEFDNISASPNTVFIKSPILKDVNANFTMSISYKKIPLTKSLEELIDENPACETINYLDGIQGIVNDDDEAIIFVEVPCGEYLGQTIIYTRNEDTLYVISVDSRAGFNQIKSYVDKIVSTMTFLGSSTSLTPTQQLAVCAQDAKQCPDGTFVGRTGPNCEFICPIN